MTVYAELNAYRTEKYTEEELALVQGVFPTAHLNSGSSYLYGAEGLVDVDALQELVNVVPGLTPTIKPFKGNAFFREKRGIEERLRELEVSGSLIKQQIATSGIAMQVHVPNFSLLSFNRVLLAEDCCTDELQAKLDDGWRIIAVCPPLDERRPTYIMGRCVPENVPNTGRGACR